MNMMPKWKIADVPEDGSEQGEQTPFQVYDRQRKTDEKRFIARFALLVLGEAVDWQLVTALPTHFTGGETESQWGQALCPMSHSTLEAELGLSCL